jgi:polar amino acid transport system substrate-binding protein
MRRTQMRCLLLTLAALFVCCAQSIPAADKVYINGIDANFPPFSFVDRSGHPDGFDVKALDWIAEEMKFKVKHQPMDWDEIIPSLIAKKIDIIASGLSITDERKGQVAFSAPYWKVKQVLVVKKDARTTAEKVLTEGNKIGVEKGTTEARWIEETLVRIAGAKFELVPYDSTLLAVEDVLTGRITAVAMDDSLALDAAKKRPVKILGGFGMPDESFAYAVRKEDGEFLKKLNEGLRMLMKSSYWTMLKHAYIEK